MNPAESGTRTSLSAETRPADDAGGRFLPGTVLGGRYRMIGLLGRGGMGEVYRADDLKLGQPVALKFLPLDVERDPSRLDRFLNEVRTSLRVTHPNVCRVFDVGQIDQRHFLSMEYVDGEDLGSLLRRIGRLPEDKAVEIARQLCAGLAAAHDEGVLHRDIKPANIMIDGRGRAKITDFGLAGAIAGIEGAEARAGTPQYMAPEQADGRALSERTDLYALGLVLYELFTGRRPYEVRSLDDVRHAHGSVPTSPTSHVSGLDPLVERAILRCLEPDPAKRPSSASALAAALPGGDPLAMSIAAGDTPSPEMVAAAGAEIGITAKAAGALLGVALVGTIAMALLAGRVAVYAIGAPVKPPEVLVEKAREMLDGAGVRANVVDSAWGIDLDFPYVNSSRAIEKEDPDALAKYGIFFWYRQSPVQLDRTSAVTPYLLLSIWDWDPPMSYSGESLVMLDREGRLVRFRTLPPQRPSSAVERADVNWTALFKAAGLDETTWVSAEPEWVPADYADRRWAWTPRGRQPTPAVRIEAATFQGVPTAFTLVFPWTTAERDIGTSRSAEKRAGDLFAIVFIGAVMLGAVVMARRNLRLDRADRKGALRIGLATSGLVWLTWLCDEHHVASIWEMYLLFVGSGLALFLGCVLATFYLALEPQVRRRWPSVLVSSSRLLAGDLMNPLVARDVLIGVAVFVVGYSIDLAGMLLARRVTGLMPVLESSPRAFLGGLHLISQLAFETEWGITLALICLLLYYVLRRIVRVEWAAIAVCAVLMSVASSGALGGGGAMVRLLFEFVFVAAVFVVLARVGLVAAIAGSVVQLVIQAFPLTWPVHSAVNFIGVLCSATLVVVAYRMVQRALARTAS